MDRGEFNAKARYGMIESEYLEKDDYEVYQGLIIIKDDEKAFISKKEIDDYFENVAND